MSLSPSRVYKVIPQYSETSKASRFGRTLFVTIETNSDIDEGKLFPVKGPRAIKEIASSLEGQAIFPQNQNPETNRAIGTFFQQQLNNIIMIARWNNNAKVSAKYFGKGKVAAAATLVSSLSDGAGVARINFAGQAIDVTLAASDTSYALIATALQAALLTNTNFTGVTVSGSANGFTISGIDYDVMDNAFKLSGSSAAGNNRRGDDFIKAIGMDTGLSSGYTPAETMLTFLNRLLSENHDFDFIVPQYFDAASAANKKTIRDAIESFVSVNPQKAIIEFDETDVTGASSIFSTGDITSPGAVFAAHAEENVWCIGDKTPTRDYKSVRLASAYAGVDYYGEDTYLNAKLIHFPGSKPTQLNEEEATALDAKRFNFYTKYIGAGDFFAEGVTLKPDAYIDSSVTLFWLSKALASAMWGIRRTSPNLAGLTGINKAHAAIIPVLNAARTNGSIVSGILNKASISEYQRITGINDFDGEAAGGYVLYTLPLSSRSPTDIRDRIMPDTYIWVNLADPFHFATLRVIGREGGSEIEVTETTEDEDNS